VWINLEEHMKMLKKIIIILVISLLKYVLYNVNS